MPLVCIGIGLAAPVSLAVPVTATAGAHAAARAHVLPVTAVPAPPMISVSPPVEPQEAVEMRISPPTAFANFASATETVALEPSSALLLPTA